MSSISTRVAAAADDACRGSAAFYSGTNDLPAGKPYAGSDVFRSSYFRFTNVNIAKSTTVTSAYIVLTSISDESGTTVNSTLKGEASDSAAQITSLAIWNARTKTTASVSWNSMASWVNGSTYNTPDISSVIQEIINRVGWVSGNAINIFWEDNASTNGSGRIAAAYEQSPSLAPLLVINYGTPSGTSIFGDQGMVA